MWHTLTVEMFFSLKEEGISNTCYDMGESGGYYSN